MPSPSYFALPLRNFRLKLNTSTRFKIPFIIRYTCTYSFKAFVSPFNPMQRSFLWILFYICIYASNKPKTWHVEAQLAMKSSTGASHPHSLHKQNSWTYNFVEVSGHNLENSQTWGFCVQCLHYKPASNHFCSRGRGGGGVKSVVEKTFVPITSKNSASD